MEIVAKRIYREIENILIRNNKVPNNVNQKANNIFKCVQALKSYCQQYSDLHYNLIVEYYETPFTINRDQKLKQFADKYSINISHVYLIRREILLRFLVILQQKKLYTIPVENAWLVFNFMVYFSYK